MKIRPLAEELNFITKENVKKNNRDKITEILHRAFTLFSWTFKTKMIILAQKKN